MGLKRQPDTRYGLPGAVCWGVCDFVGAPAWVCACGGHCGFSGGHRAWSEFIYCSEGHRLIRPRGGAQVALRKQFCDRSPSALPAGPRPRRAPVGRHTLPAVSLMRHPGREPLPLGSLVNQSGLQEGEGCESLSTIRLGGLRRE